jgi:NAD(P)-dependent dehydrogenase (short-subunit alcohol dehydrogenase family)
MAYNVVGVGWFHPIVASTWRAVGVMKLAKIADSDDALVDRQIAVNLKGSFNAMREAGKRLRDGGRIVNFSTSVAGTNWRLMASMPDQRPGAARQWRHGVGVSVRR